MLIFYFVFFCFSVCFVFFCASVAQVKSRTNVRGMVALGNLHGLTSWPATSGSTRDKSRSVATCASVRSHDPTICHCTWSDTDVIDHVGCYTFTVYYSLKATPTHTHTHPEKWLHQMALPSFSLFFKFLVSKFSSVQVTVKTSGQERHRERGETINIIIIIIG